MGLGMLQLWSKGVRFLNVTFDEAVEILNRVNCLTGLFDPRCCSPDVALELRLAEPERDTVVHILDGGQDIGAVLATAASRRIPWDVLTICKFM